MLRLLSCKAQERKYFGKPPKPCYVGTHWKALTEYFHMSTHITGFRWIFNIFALFCIGQLRHQQIYPSIPFIKTPPFAPQGGGGGGGGGGGSTSTIHPLSAG